MTPKQRRFVEEYCIDLNATQAAIRAGYSANGAAVRGVELVRNRKVAAAIAERQNAVASKLGITQERIASELACLGFSNMGDYMRVGPEGDPVLDFSNLTRDQTAALTEVTVEDFKDGRGEETRDVRRVKFKLADKRAALVDLGRHIGMFKDDSARNAPPPVTVNIIAAQIRQH